MPVEALLSIPQEIFEKVISLFLCSFIISAFLNLCQIFSATILSSRIFSFVLGHFMMSFFLKIYLERAENVFFLFLNLVSPEWEQRETNCILLMGERKK